MAKILITGNGYDISKGLPTSYKDFINILNKIKLIDNYNFKEIYSLTYNDELLFNTYKEIKFNNESIEVLKNKISNNFWFDFFSEELEIESWIDFENKIEYLIKNIIRGTINIEELIFNNGTINNLNINHNSNDILNGNFELIDILKKLELISGGYAGFNLTDKYLINRKDYYKGIDFEKISKKLIEELNEFKEIFSLYFRIFVYPLYETIKIDKSKILSFERINNHLTFNYTPTFEKFQKGRDKTHYLHGKISEENNIVLGINDISNEINKTEHFIPFTKYFQKFNNNTYFKFISNITKKRLNHQFFFYGHSLDVSDKYYIDEVFEFILDDTLKTKNEIIIIYHDDESKSKLLQNLLHIRGQKDIQKLMNSDKLLFINVNSQILQNKINEDISVRSRAKQIELQKTKAKF